MLLNNLNSIGQVQRLAFGAKLVEGENLNKGLEKNPEYRSEISKFGEKISTISPELTAKVDYKEKVGFFASKKSHNTADHEKQAKYNLTILDSNGKPLKLPLNGEPLEQMYYGDSLSTTLFRTWEYLLKFGK